MKKDADLHIHTFYSDSTDSPEEVVKSALQEKLSCIAITDHDTLEGIKPTQVAAQNSDLEVLSGVELSAEIEKKDIHILGYLVDDGSRVLSNRLKEIQNLRLNRIKKMIELLKSLGVDNIRYEEVCQLTQSDSVGRPHLARVLLQKGWVKTIKEAFDKYLAEGAPAYVPKFKMTPLDAIELIRKSGGIPVLAHPMMNNRDEIIPSLVEAGLLGIEVYYPNCSETVIKYYEEIAKKHNLITTGGSDAHGRSKENTFIGKKRISYEIVEQLKQAARQLTKNPH